MNDQANPPVQSGSTPTPPPPPRPGQPVPAGGLDPTQVFATPPQPPKAQGDDGQPIPKDQSPPPPPVGAVYTEEWLKSQGYDEEDIKALKQILDYRFGSIADKLSNDKISIPPHPETQFNEQEFLNLLRGSISLTRDEKWRIIQALPKLSQFQITELQKILSEERQKFAVLSPKHLPQLQKLEQQHANEWADLQMITEQQDVKAEEQNQADAIRKQLGL